MGELWISEKGLITKPAWEKTIKGLKSKEQIISKAATKKLLKETLIAAIKKRIPSGRYGIFFSGGVDSSFIAAVARKINSHVTCYAVGFQDEDTKLPEDVQEAQKVARKLNIDLKFHILDLKEAEKIIKKTVQILKKVNKVDVVSVGVGSVIVAAAALAKKDRITAFFSGLGSEEIFAGYERHLKAKEVNKECWRGLKEMWERDLKRDAQLGKALKITVHTPFLDPEVIKVVMQLPGEWKINEQEKKIILREVAEEFLGNFAWRKKKAAQYGSCFDKAIGKLARKNGFQLKKEYLERL